MLQDSLEGEVCFGEDIIGTKLTTPESVLDSSPGCDGWTVEFHAVIFQELCQ
jgi:hypothetical protein